jgi:hypothetical protein
MPILQINFQDEQQAKDFAVWMCEAGEQYYWQHAEGAELENPIQHFDYDYDNLIIDTK